MSKTLVLFDFDGTLTKNDTYIKFIIFTKGYFRTVIGFTLFSPLIVLYKFNIVNGNKLKIALTTYFFKGWKESRLKSKGIEFIKVLIASGCMNESVYNQLKKHKLNGNEICIVSASLDLWIEPFSGKHNVNFLCTELKFKKGFFNGEFNTKNCNGDEKAIRITNRYDLKNYTEIIAYGNSDGDKEMFDLASKVIMVKS